MNSELPYTTPPEASEPARPQVNAKDIAAYALRAARRHVALCIGVGLGVAVLGCALVSAIPSVYDSTTKIYASRNVIITAELASGRRSDDSYTDRGLSEAVLNHANLVSLVREAKLIEKWPATRTWLLRIKDSVASALFGPLSRKEAERVIIEMLEKSLSVTAEDSGAIRFRAEWRNAKDAYTLTTLAERNFVNARKTEELAAITRAAALLEDELKRADDAIAPAVKDVQDSMAKARAKAVPPARTLHKAPAPVALPAPKPIVPLVAQKTPAELTDKLEQVRRAERDLIEPWQRRAAELKFQLAEVRAIYGPEHPLVLQAQSKLRVAQEEPPELAALKRQEATLMDEIAQLAAAVQQTPAVAVRHLAASSGEAGASDAESLRALMTRDDAEDPEVSAARIRLENAMRKSEELQSRLDTARLELATAQAGFKYRYSVVEPPEVARHPFKPNRPRLYLIVLVASALLGLCAGGVREWLTGRILEPWQMRRLGLELLAEVNVRQMHLRRR